MEKINVEDLKPGMVLAEEIKTPQGRLLLPKGTSLTEQHFRIFKIWGTTTAGIEGISGVNIEQSKMAQLDPAVLKTVENLAAEKFRHANVDHEVTLASAPEIYIRITEALKNKNSSTAYLADVIAGDVSFSAKLLKLVNSSFYGFPQKIDSLSQAVMIIGTHQLSSLALGISLISTVKGVPTEIIDMKRFWRHSVACGLLSRFIASRFNHDEERCFVAGFLHDIGRLIMLTTHPEWVVRTLFESHQSKRELHAVETECWGFCHSQLAGQLFQNWRFPVILENAVRFHHTPEPSIPESGIVHLADIIAHAVPFGASGAPHMPALDPGTWRSLGLLPSNFAPLIIQTEYHIEELLTTFFSEI